ncbi:MAG: DUF4034 domain-containing protein [Pseudomonadota bacterium]
MAMVPAHAARWLAVALCLAVAPAMGAEGGALMLTEAKALLWRGDTAALENAFAAHREAFAARSLTAEAFAEPFEAFRVYHAPHRAAIKGWVADYPESSAAAAALGAALEAQAAVETDARSIDALQQDQALLVLDATRLSAAAYSRALELSPRQVFAAERILRADPRMLPPGAADAALATLNTDGSPLVPLRLAVERARHNDEGYSDEVLGLCEAVIPEVDGLLLEECLAFAFRDRTVSMVNKARYLIILEADEERHFPRAVFDLTLEVKGARDAMAFASEAGLHFSDKEIFNQLGAYNEERTLADASLAHDPTDPLMLAGRAWAHALDGEYEMAAAGIREAHVHGGHLSVVWRLEEQILAESGRMHELLPWFERAVTTPGLDPEAYVNAVSGHLRRPDSEAFRGPDGKPLPDAACRASAVIMTLRSACDRMPVPDSHCMPEALERLEADADRLAESCGG